MTNQRNINAEMTKAQRQQYSENALKTQFHVDWLLYPYDGKHANNYPGCIAARQHPTYGNCRRCHLMGPMGEQCADCGVDDRGFFSTYVLILAEQQLCDPRERWYNPEFLHNTNDATRIVEAPFLPDMEIDPHLIWAHLHHPTVRRRLCNRHHRRPYPEMLGPHPCGKENFKEHMRTIYLHPLRDDLGENEYILTKNSDRV